MNLPIVVMKFGGTSVEDSEAFERVACIVGAQTHVQPVVVVSAMRGVTDALVSSFRLATKGAPTFAAQSLDDVYQRHLDVAENLLPTNDYHDYQAALDIAARHISELLYAIAKSRRPVHPSQQDSVISCGEQLSAVLLTLVLNAAKQPASFVDARKCIITDETYGCGVPLVEMTNLKTCWELGPVIESGEVPVLGGFIGATESGVTTTLGRNGSDYSGAIIGAALNASEIQIWTDVTGVLTADPRLVKTARTIPSMSYEEATELSRLGSKVIYPQAIGPAAAQRIPLRICNSRAPYEEGTLIGMEKTVSPGVIKSIAHRPPLEHDGRCALISIIGEGLHADQAVSMRALEVLREMSIYPVVLNGSTTSLSFLMDEARSVDAVRLLHQTFFEAAHAQDDLRFDLQFSPNVKDLSVKAESV